jgi:hypothetical protein
VRIKKKFQLPTEIVDGVVKYRPFPVTEDLERLIELTLQDCFTAENSISNPVQFLNEFVERLLGIQELIMFCVIFNKRRQYLRFEYF